MNRVMGWGTLAVMVGLVGIACSNDDTRKKPTDKDASAYDGSNEGGGTGGASGTGGVSGTGGSAGADAAAGTAGMAGAAGTAGTDAGVDAPAEADAGLVCQQGTIKDTAAQLCRTCPVDGGAAGAAGAPGDAGPDPYQAVIACSDFDAASSGFDAATGLLTLRVAYPLELTSFTYDIDVHYMDATGGQNSQNVTGTISVNGNTVVVDIGAVLADAGATSVLAVSVNVLDFTDACGRVSGYSYCNPEYLDFVQQDGSTVWAISCSQC